MSLDEPSHAELEPALPESLRIPLDQIAAAIAQIAAHIAQARPADIALVLAEHREMFYQAMVALGDRISDFLAENPPPAQVQAVREQVVARIREWSSTSPLLQHSLRKPRGQSSDPELVKRLLEKRPAGADIPALIFNDFYMYSIGGLAYRGRLELLIRAVQRAVSQRAAMGAKLVRVLSLHVSGAGEILSLAQDETFAEVAQVTCIDNRPAALREIRRDLKGQLGKRGSFVRADALHYAERPDRPTQQHDVIYGVSIFEHLDANQAIRLARGCHTLLAPGGVLLAGSVAPGVPVSEQILREWLTGWDLHYRDEATWRDIFAHAGFDAEGLRFEYETHKANVLVSAERR